MAYKEDAMTTIADPTASNARVETRRDEHIGTVYQPICDPCGWVSGWSYVERENAERAASEHACPLTFESVLPDAQIRRDPYYDRPCVVCGANTFVRLDYSQIAIPSEGIWREVFVNLCPVCVQVDPHEAAARLAVQGDMNGRAFARDIRAALGERA